MFPALLQSIKKVRQLTLVTGETDILQTVELPCEQTQVSMHHRAMVGAGIQREEFLENTTRLVVLQKPLQAVSAATSGGDKKRRSRGDSIHFQFVGGSHKDIENGLRLSHISATEECCANAQHLLKQPRR